MPAGRINSELGPTLSVKLPGFCKVPPERSTSEFAAISVAPGARRD